MVAAKSTRNHSIPGRLLGITVLTLALTAGGLGGLEAFNLGAANLSAGASGGPPALKPVASVPAPVATASPTPDPTAAPTLDPTPTPSSTPATTSTPEPTVVPSATPVAVSDGRMIVVSVANQRLTAFKDGVAVMTSVVATGMPELATPKGTYHIKAKYTPYTFVSPWPRGSRFWYPTLTVSWAMLFADDGYFLHDSPHRTVYGPGANLRNGTHGCVNIPTAFMSQLFSWASVGTTVVVQ